jgi:hypothetical protein
MMNDYGAVEVFVIMDRILPAFTMLGPADKPNNPHTTKIQDTEEKYIVTHR